MILKMLQFEAIFPILIVYIFLYLEILYMNIVVKKRCKLYYRKIGLDQKLVLDLIF